jgi:cytochrome c oxidase assembly protein subunit 15
MAEKFMTIDTAASKPGITRGHRTLFGVAAVMSYLMIVMGGIVCVTGSGAGCPDWPACYGGVIPPMQATAVIEYLHRFVAGIALLVMLAAAIISWRHYRSIRLLRWPITLAVILTLVVSGFGATAVLRGLSREQAAIDLGLALTVLALMTTAMVVTLSYRADSAFPDRLSARSGFAWLAFWTLGVVFMVLVSSVLVAGEGSLTRCLGWPMWRLMSIDLPGWAQPVRLIAAGVTGVSILAVVVQAWRTQRRQPAISRVAAAAGLLFALEMLIGAIMLAGATSMSMLIAYVATAAAVWTLVVALAVLAGLDSAASSLEQKEFIRHGPSASKE